MSNNVWQHTGDSYYPSNTAAQAKSLPPAIYRFVQTQTGWFLEKTSDRYTFPYKIYGTSDKITNRIKAAWSKLPSNFGILLNGLKGTGKTITAQQIVNWAIDSGIAVLNVSQPIPLADIMTHIEQPLLVLFDEFEKTHDETRSAGCQQELLTAIDGVARNEYRRMFLFTTNTKKVNENFIDRPSRIRYCWEFGRMGPDLIEMVIDDLLDKSLAHFKAGIIGYLNSREVLTMDVVKTVITECNIFREPPADFAEVMNLTEKEPAGYTLEIVESDGRTTELCEHFKTSNGPWLQSVLSKSGQKMFIDQYCQNNRTQLLANSSGLHIDMLGPTDKENEWICYVQVPTYKTWLGPKLCREVADYLWLDEQPIGWRTPEWGRKFESGVEMTEAESDAYDAWSRVDSVFGGKPKKVRLRFKINEAAYVYKFGDPEGQW